MKHEGKDWHMVAVLPANDTVHHDGMDEDCVCGPTVQPVERDDGSYGWVLVHHALGGGDPVQETVWEEDQ